MRPHPHGTVPASDSPPVSKGARVGTPVHLTNNPKVVHHRQSGQKAFGVSTCPHQLNSAKSKFEKTRNCGHTSHSSERFDPMST